MPRLKRGVFIGDAGNRLYRQRKRPAIKNRHRIVLLVLLLLLLLVWQQGELRLLRTQVMQQEEVLGKAASALAMLNERLVQVEEFLRPALVQEKEVTAYAPLDPESIVGMCRDTTPEITASGEPPVPGRTAAAGPALPFGSMVYIAGRGWYKVNDRGGAIENGQLDVVVSTVTEAIIFGRQRLQTLIVPAE